MTHTLVPFEIVKRVADGNGLAKIVRSAMAGAVFQRLARVDVRNDRFVAELDFEEPVNGELGIIIGLPVRPERVA